MAISCRRRAAGATRGVHYHRASGTLVSCTMTTSATSPASESRDSVVIRFAGDSGDGMQVTGGRFTVETALAGNDLTTFPDYPAEIRAPAGTTYGVSAFQIHFGAVDVMTPGDQVDVLVAMNPAALKVDLKDLRIGGTLVVDTGAFSERNLTKAGFKANPLDDGSLAPYQVLKLDITKLTLDAVKDSGLHTREAHRCRNMWALGLMLWMYGRDRDATLAWLKQKFAGRPEIAQGNVAALNAGHAYGETAEMSEYGGGYTVRRAPVTPGVYRTMSGTEAMDVDGLVAVLRRIERGEISCIAVDTPMPSPFCHEILNANPYAYLDDAPLEERRARAVEMRRSLPPELAGNLGALDPVAIAEVAEESWPVVRDADELHDALLTLVWLPEEQAGTWGTYLPALIEAGRATVVTVPAVPSPHASPVESLWVERPLTPHAAKGWVATERLGLVQAAFPEAAFSPMVREMGETRPERGEALLTIVQGWLEGTGPTTAEELAGKLSLSTQDVNGVLLQLESQGQVLRGRFRPNSALSTHD